jgi:hypothetical protein
MEGQKARTLTIHPSKSSCCGTCLSFYTASREFREVALPFKLPPVTII